MKSIRYRFRTMQRAMHREIREHKSTFIVFSILRALIIVVMVLQFFNKNYENVFLCGATLVLMLIPSFVQLEFRVELPKTLEIIILLFIFSAEILGEIGEFYIRVPWWDTLLHTMNGFLAAAVGFSMIDLLNRSKKSNLNLSPAYLALVAFCFSMTIGVLWEFFEFSMDYFFFKDMQKDTIIHTIKSVMLNQEGHNDPIIIRNIKEVTINGQTLPFDGYLDIGLIDTMKDLFVNFIGAVVFSIFGYFYLKNRGKNGKNRGKMVKSLLPKPMTKEQDFLTQELLNASHHFAGKHPRLKQPNTFHRNKK